MGLALNTFSNDTVMRVLEDAGPPIVRGVRTELDTLFEWLRGGIQAADVGAGVLPAEVLYRPDFYGFPTNGSIGRFQETRARRLVTEVSGLYSTAIKLNPTERWDTFFNTLDVDGRAMVKGQTLDVLSSPCRLEVDIEWSAICFHNWVPAGTGLGYPSYQCGRFIIGHRLRAATSWTFHVASARELMQWNDQNGSPGSRREAFDTQISILIGAAGTYDVALFYEAPDYGSVVNVTNLMQVAAHHINLKITVQKD